MFNIYKYPWPITKYKHQNSRSHTILRRSKQVKPYLQRKTNTTTDDDVNVTFILSHHHHTSVYSIAAEFSSSCFHHKDNYNTNIKLYPYHHRYIRYDTAFPSFVLYCIVCFFELDFGISLYGCKDIYLLSTSVEYIYVNYL